MPTLFKDVEDTRTLAQAIVDTVREPLLVLDGDLTVLAVSRSYCSIFRVQYHDVLGRALYVLGDGQWRIPALHTILEKIVRERAPMEGFEVDHVFPGIGRRVMLLNARKVFYADHARSSVLLAFEDVTERRTIEREKEELLRQTEELLLQKDVLLRELEHRVGNSLQMIASILMLKVRSVGSDETRLHLRDVYQRVMAIAAVQQHLHTSARFDHIEIGPYLTSLCESLAESMIGDSRSISLLVRVNGGTAEYATAVSLGLIVTELVINALKYAFPRERPSGQVFVDYHFDVLDWKLTVSDNGIGKAEGLNAEVEVLSGPEGVVVSLTHANPDLAASSLAAGA